MYNIKLTAILELIKFDNDFIQSYSFYLPVLKF